MERCRVLANSLDLPREVLLAMPLQYGADEGVERECGSSEHDHHDREHRPAEGAGLGVLPDEGCLPEVADRQVLPEHQGEGGSQEDEEGTTEGDEPCLPADGGQLVVFDTKNGGEQEHRTEDTHHCDESGGIGGSSVVVRKVHGSVLSDSGSGWNSVELQLIW